MRPGIVLVNASDFLYSGILTFPVDGGLVANGWVANEWVGGWRKCNLG
jgi:hypothetical protein